MSWIKICGATRRDYASLFVQIREVLEQLNVCASVGFEK